MNLLPFVFGLLDIPIRGQAGKSVHKFESTEGRGMKITAATNMVLFKKDLSESSNFEEVDVVIKHRYFDYNDSDKIKQVTNFKVNHPYECQIIASNLSDQPIPEGSLLMTHIPSGAIPLSSFKYVDNHPVSLEPFSNTKRQTVFYFPSAGQFDHAPSNISVEKKVIAISEAVKLNVGKTVEVQDVETFKNLMLSIKGEAQKKQKLLELFTTKEDLFTDTKFKFELNGEVMWVLKNDKRLYLDVMKVCN